MHAATAASAAATNRPNRVVLEVPTYAETTRSPYQLNCDDVGTARQRSVPASARLAAKAETNGRTRTRNREPFPETEVIPSPVRPTGAVGNIRRGVLPQFASKPRVADVDQRRERYTRFGNLSLAQCPVSNDALYPKAKSVTVMRFGEGQWWSEF